MNRASFIQGTRGKLLLGLIGSGIQASRTPAMHEHEAAEHELSCVYQLVDLEVLGLGVEALPDLLTAAERMGFSGLNITFPCKQAVLPLLDHISEDARALGAVNTVELRDGKRLGHNTDWLGFSASFRRGLSGAAHDRVVQLGAGGAGAATAYAMLKMGVGHLTLVDPEVNRAAMLAARLGSIFGKERITSSDSVGRALDDADGLIHATPMGMYGHSGIALPVELLRKDCWVAEIVYFPLETELLRAARAVGCPTLDGSWMAVYQAAEAFHLFTGLQPDPERMHSTFINRVREQ
jgi:shikimate dehydrogenase